MVTKMITKTLFPIVMALQSPSSPDVLVDTNIGRVSNKENLAALNHPLPAPVAALDPAFGSLRVPDQSQCGVHSNVHTSAIPAATLTTCAGVGDSGNFAAAMLAVYVGVTCYLHH